MWVGLSIVDTLGLRPRDTLPPPRWRWGLGTPGLGKANSAGSLSGHAHDPHEHLMGNTGVRDAEGAPRGRVCCGNSPRLPS